MGLLSRLFGRKPVLSPEVVDRVVGTVARVIDRARDIAEMRERMARAARAGDLDFLINAIEADRRLAEQYVRGG